MNDVLGNIVHTVQVAHVTFSITETPSPGDPEDWDEIYTVYSETEKDGVKPIQGMLNYSDAVAVVRQEVERLEQILERKRKGMPTQKQVYFLFQKKIPIPLDLTWGEASDLIDEWLVTEKQRKLQAQAEKFKGFTVGMRVYQHSYQNVRGKWRINGGEITKLTSNNHGNNYAYVKWDGGNDVARVSIDTLQKTEASEEQLRALEPKYQAGDTVSHPSFGVGTVLHAGDTLAAVQFQGSEKLLNLAELTLGG